LMIDTIRIESFDLNLVRRLIMSLKLTPGVKFTSVAKVQTVKKNNRS